MSIVGELTILKDKSYIFSVITENISTKDGMNRSHTMERRMERQLWAWLNLEATEIPNDPFPLKMQCLGSMP